MKVAAKSRTHPTFLETRNTAKITKLQVATGCYTTRYFFCNLQRSVICCKLQEKSHRVTAPLRNEQNSPSTTKLTFVEINPAGLEAVQVYVLSNFALFFTLYNARSPFFMLCSGRGPLLKFHVIEGGGLPLALQGNVTFCPSTTTTTRSVGRSLNWGTTANK